MESDISDDGLEFVTINYDTDMDIPDLISDTESVYENNKNKLCKYNKDSINRDYCLRLQEKNEYCLEHYLFMNKDFKYFNINLYIISFILIYYIYIFQNKNNNEIYNKCFWCKNEAEPDEDCCEQCIWEQQTTNSEIINNTYLEYVKDIILIENKFITSYNNNLLNKVIQNEYKNLLYRKIDYKNKKKKKKKANIIISDKDYYGIEIYREYFYIHIDDYLTIYENKNNIDFNIIKKNVIYNRNKKYIDSSYQVPDDVDTYFEDFGRKPDNICIYCYNHKDINHKYVCKDCYFEYKNKIINFSYYMKNKYKINIKLIEDKTKLIRLFKYFNDNIFK